jgi:uncharacterized protein YjcR
MPFDWDEIKREYEVTDITLADLAEKYDIKYSTIKSRKQRQGWIKKDASLDASKNKKDASIHKKDASIKNRGAPRGNHNAGGHGAPKGNKNAVGNQGGPPPGNKNAVTTGEFESIWFDCLTDEEKILCGAINTDTLAQVEEDIRLITLRERRMMERIRRIMDGLTEKERRVLQELQIQKHPMEVYDEKAGQIKVIAVPVPKMIVTEIRETEYRAIDDILKLEEALTRVQEKKTRQLALKHTIEMADKGGEGDAVAKEHAKRVQEAWANR